MFKVIFIGLLISALILIGPYFTISSLNVLFDLSIPFNFTTWASVIWLSIALRSAVTVNNKLKE